MLAFIDMPGLSEIVMILFVALLLFGGRLPEVAKKVGKSVANLKKNAETLKSEFQKGMDSVETEARDIEREARVEDNSFPSIAPDPAPPQEKPNNKKEGLP